jgi:hypothetical protein
MVPADMARPPKRILSRQRLRLEGVPGGGSSREGPQSKELAITELR